MRNGLGDEKKIRNTAETFGWMFMSIGYIP